MLFTLFVYPSNTFCSNSDMDLTPCGTIPQLVQTIASITTMTTVTKISSSLATSDTTIPIYSIASHPVAPVITAQYSNTSSDESQCTLRHSQTSTDASSQVPSTCLAVCVLNVFKMVELL